MRGKKTTAATFWGRIQHVGECWEWQGTISRSGYGVISVSSKGVRAHRYAWYLTYGDIPKSLCVCHKCDNRKCVRPDHLFLGTKADNAADMACKGRVRIRKLTDMQVKDIRALHVTGKIGCGKLAKRFGVSKYVVQSVVRRKSYKHIPHDPLYVATDPGVDADAIYYIQWCGISYDDF